ncbi:MAG: amidohydrolase [Acidobacteria bacterium]|nr:amidohydrolase [Acidobacteriota bacterium]
MSNLKRVLLFGIASAAVTAWLGPHISASPTGRQTVVRATDAQGGTGSTAQSVQQGRAGRGGRGGRGAVIRPVNGACPSGTLMIAPDQCSRTVPPVDGECPPGTTLQRPGSCMLPEFEAPSILDYRPRSTLVVDEHMVPRAKYPVIDIHSHLGISEANIEKTITEMDALNLQVLVNLSGGSDPDVMKSRVDLLKGSRYADRFAIFANVNWDRPDAPGWAAKAVADLEASVKNGAVGLKIAKGLGLQSVKTDGTLVKVNDPLLDPIWDACARLNIPVIIHTAEPEEFFSPLDMRNERWLELALFEDRRNYMPGRPLFPDMQRERDELFITHPRTTFIGAHFAYYGNNLKKAAELLDKAPNVVLEVAAVLYDFARQPRAAREFFIKYQDRVLFGKDAYYPEEYPYYWRVFETADEYFDYYRPYHAFWKLYGMDLPDEVLKKLYYKNALRVTPGLPQSGWPQ